MNKKTHIVSDSDLEEVCNEVNQLSPESILNEHVVTRLRNDHSSALRLKRIIAIKMFITKYEYSEMVFDQTSNDANA